MNFDKPAAESSRQYYRLSCTIVVNPWRYNRDPTPHMKNPFFVDRRCVMHLTVMCDVGFRLWRQGLTISVQPGNAFRFFDAAPPQSDSKCGLSKMSYGITITP